MADLDSQLASLWNTSPAKFPEWMRQLLLAGEKREQAIQERVQDGLRDTLKDAARRFVAIVGGHDVPPSALDSLAGKFREDWVHKYARVWAPNVPSERIDSWLRKERVWTDLFGTTVRELLVAQPVTTDIKATDVKATDIKATGITAPAGAGSGGWVWSAQGGYRWRPGSGGGGGGGSVAVTLPEALEVVAAQGRGLVEDALFQVLQANSARAPKTVAQLRRDLAGWLPQVAAGWGDETLTLAAEVGLGAAMQELYGVRLQIFALQGADVVAAPPMVGDGPLVYLVRDSAGYAPLRARPLTVPDLRPPGVRIASAVNSFVVSTFEPLRQRVWAVSGPARAYDPQLGGHLEDLGSLVSAVTNDLYRLAAGTPDEVDVVDAVARLGELSSLAVGLGERVERVAVGSGRVASDQGRVFDDWVAALRAAGGQVGRTGLPVDKGKGVAGPGVAWVDSRRLAAFRRFAAESVLLTPVDGREDVWALPGGEVVVEVVGSGLWVRPAVVSAEVAGAVRESLARADGRVRVSCGGARRAGVGVGVAGSGVVAGGGSGRAGVGRRRGRRPGWGAGVAVVDIGRGAGRGAAVAGGGLVAPGRARRCRAGRQLRAGRRCHQGAGGRRSQRGHGPGSGRG